MFPVKAVETEDCAVVVHHQIATMARVVNAERRKAALPPVGQKAPQNVARAAGPQGKLIHHETQPR
jgi:dTDP-4-dehydrorhamnose reductase